MLNAVLLADSFTQVLRSSPGFGHSLRCTNGTFNPIHNLQRFRPITVERPKVLLPLVNVPMIEYTLEWLAMNKVEEVSCGPGQASF